MNPLKNFRWWRRWRGGRWARVTGWLWGVRWVRIPRACVERPDEDYYIGVDLAKDDSDTTVMYEHPLGKPSRHWPSSRERE